MHRGEGGMVSEGGGVKKKGEKGWGGFGENL